MSKRVRCLLCALLVLLGLHAIAAEEITINTYLNVLKGQFSLLRQVTGQKVTMNGANMSYSIQTISTTDWQQISISASVTTNGYCWFRNLETNTARSVEIGSKYVSSLDTGYTAFITLKATEIAMLRLHPTNTIWAKAYGVTNGDPGAPAALVNLENWIIED